MLALAERQHGVVSRAQLLAAGVSRDQIDKRVACGRLLVIHRGVYAVGHRVLTREGRWMAAVLAGGSDAAVSVRAAAAMRGLHPPTGLIDVTVPRSRRPRRGLCFHRAALPADEITVVDGIRVTTVPRTLFDLAGVQPRPRVEKAINEAEVRRLWDPLSLQDMLDRHPGAPGAATIRAVLEAGRIGDSLSASELELRFLAFLDDQRLPRPDANAAIHLGHRHADGDMVWPSARLIVELDGRGVHDTRAAFEADRERDRRLLVAGWRVVRITWRQLHDEPWRIAADLRLLLGLEATSPVRRG